MESIAVLAPHPDDETLGCAGTLLRLRESGCALHWILGTQMDQESGYTPTRIKERAAEIKQVEDFFGFRGVHPLGFSAAGLDRVPLSEIVTKLGVALKEIDPDMLLIPHRGDAHSDHRILHETAVAASKTFRQPGIRRVLAYETPSETEFGLIGDPFIPNSFCDISDHLENKLEAFRIYAGEGGEHPFPRSEEAIRGLAQHRGAAAGFSAAEAFMILKERW